MGGAAGSPDSRSSDDTSHGYRSALPPLKSNQRLKLSLASKAAPGCSTTGTESPPKCAVLPMTSLLCRSGRLGLARRTHQLDDGRAIARQLGRAHARNIAQRMLIIRQLARDLAHRRIVQNGVRRHAVFVRDATPPLTQ